MKICIEVESTSYAKNAYYAGDSLWLEAYEIEVPDDFDTDKYCNDQLLDMAIDHYEGNKNSPVKFSVCPECAGSGEFDSGGFSTCGEPVAVSCQYCEVAS